MNNELELKDAIDVNKVKQHLILLGKLEQEYKELSDKCNKLYAFLYDLDLPNKVRSFDERSLMQEQHKRMEAYRTNLYHRIVFRRNEIKTACGFDVLIEWNEVADNINDIIQHHCGQDVSSESSQSSPSSENDKPVITGESIKKLMDYQVVGVCEPGFPCEGCVQDHYNTPCCKVELVGGYMLCLAPLPNSIVTE